MKKALITGASSGIGLALARAMAGAGYALTVVARSLTKLEESVARFPGSGHSAMRADLSTRDGIEGVAHRLTNEHHDVLVNNAGYAVYGRAEEVTPEDQLRMVQLNVDAVVALAHAFLAGARRGDALLNVASVVGMTSLPGAAAYAGTKSFVITFSESLWYEQRKNDVYVAAFCPGVTSSNFYQAAGVSSGGFPASMVQTPEQVAAEALRALRARRAPVVIAGAKNRALVFAGRFASRARIIKMMGGFSPSVD